MLNAMLFISMKFFSSFLLFVRSLFFDFIYFVALDINTTDKKQIPYNEKIRKKKL